MSPLVEPRRNSHEKLAGRGWLFASEIIFLRTYARSARGIFSCSCLFLAPNSPRSFIILIKVLKLYFYSFSFRKKSVMFPFYFIINVLEEFISTRAISTFNFIFLSLSLILFLSHSLFLPQTLLASHSRLSFPSTRERSRRLCCLLYRLENREKYRCIVLRGIYAAKPVHMKLSGTSFLPTSK